MAAAGFTPVQAEVITDLVRAEVGPLRHELELLKVRQESMFDKAPAQLDSIDRLDPFEDSIDMRLDKCFDKIDRRLDKMLDKMDKRLEKFEGSMEERFDQIDKRLDTLSCVLFVLCGEVAILLAQTACGHSLFP